MHSCGNRTVFPSAAVLSQVLLVCSVWALASGQETDRTKGAKQTAVDEKVIRALITQLGDDSFEKREAAHKRLATIGLPALELLRKTAKDGTDLESRERATQLVGQISLLLYRPVLKDRHWGDSADPDGDCKFFVDLGKLHIKIPGKPHRLGVEVGGMNAPRVVRTIEGDFQADVKVLGPFPSAPRSLVGKYPWYGAGLLVWQDDKNYIRLERARMDFSPANRQCYVNWELRQGGEPTRKGSGKDGMMDETQPAFLRLVRMGNSFTAAYSQDGKEWKQLPLVKTDFGKSLKVGVAAVQNTAAGYEAIFESLKFTPAKK